MQVNPPNFGGVSFFNTVFQHMLSGMASVRDDKLKDGTPVTRVLFRENGRQRSQTFTDHAVALRFKDLIEQIGPERAKEIAHIESKERRSLTVTTWVDHHIDHLTGVDQRTLQDYRGYLRNSITPVIGALPLAGLTTDDVARWVQHMRADGAKSKTLQNKHALLSAALAAAVKAGHIPANPAAGTKIPRDVRTEMVALEHAQFAILLKAVTEPWRPLVEFLVASGCRWSEATALKPGDVDRVRSTVRITRAWKRGGGYRIGPTKTTRSVRTVDVPKSVLDKLDYTGDWLFTNPGRGRRAEGGPVRAPNFRTNVWNPAVERAQLVPKPRIHDLRHTAASWWIQAGIPLPVIQRQLGHESITTTVNTYGHIDRRSAQAAAAVMAAILDPESTPES